jgi:putative hydrolase of the HAD superfamily
VLVRLDGEDGRAQWASRLGLGEDEFDTLVWGVVGSRGAADRGPIEADLAAAAGLDGADASRLLDDFSAHWVPNAPLIEYLAGLRSRYPMVVLANAGPAARFAFEEVLGLHTIFDQLLISAEIGVEKPSAEAFGLAIEALGVPATGCIFVDDLRENVAGAEAVGITAYLHESTDGTLAWLDSVLG